ncbi:MAG: phenylalanine--tRNA ligase subunit beta [Fimbriimonas sp.]
MKFPHAMLLDFVRTDLNAEQVGDLLTMAGFELEGIEEVEGDSVLDIKVMSNRGDGLSVFGLSREVLAKDLNAHPTGLYHASAARFADTFEEESETLPPTTASIESETCRRFACRAFVGVPAATASPEWMQKRLRQAGMRPISLLVDLTNYVMLEQGQPLHAFDRDRLAEGRIVVRHARPGEKLTTLNGEEHELDGQMMICDAARPVGVPGVMGGLDTEVTDETKVVLLESANFVNTTVRKTRKQLGLATEASYRFERSVDPDGVVAAIHRFTQLLQEAAPDVTVSNVVDHYPRRPERTPVRLRVARASRLLGMEITADQAEEYLGRLGMHAVRDEDVLTVTPPTWRPDIEREEDLVEELGRVHGYDRIPETPPFGTTTQGGTHGNYLRADRMRDAALRNGFVEIVSHSLRDFHPLDASGEERLGPRVPASPEHAILRNSVLPSLADAAQRNGGRSLHLFEIGRVFSGTAGNPDSYREGTTLGLISIGDLLVVDRKGKGVPSADFYSTKAALEQVLLAGGATPSYSAGLNDARLHPTRQARVLVAGRAVGLIGQIHPDIAADLKLPEATFVAEFDVTLALEAGTTEPALRSISRNPAVRRDITVAVAQDVPYQAMADRVAEACGEVLERLWLVDDYVGTGVPEGQHALTFGLQLRKIGENFTDEEANQVRDRAVAALTSLGATMR